MKIHEATVRDLLKKHWPPLGCIVERIEQKYNVGWPDLNCVYRGVEFWVELKSAKHQDVGLSNEQVVWIRNRVLAGSIVWILVRKNDDLRLYAGESVLLLHQGGLRLPAYKSAVVGDVESYKALLDVMSAPTMLTRQARARAAAR